MGRPARAFVVGIAGGTGAGKSHLACQVVQALGAGGRVCLDLDSYYLDRSGLSPDQRARINFDHPDALDWDRFYADLQRLKHGQAIAKPVYDFATHTVTAEPATIGPGDVVIVEGLMLLVEARVRDLLDLKVYLDTPADIRLLRRLERDLRERNRSLPGILQQYLDSIRPMHDRFIEPSKAYADLILPGWQDNTVAVAALAALIQGKKGVGAPGKGTGVGIGNGAQAAVERPWGSYTVLEEGPQHKVKRLTVYPGRRLSLQRHSRRSEHWVVTEGVARVTCGDRVFDLHVNDSTVIPKEAAHRLENLGPGLLHLIEVQSGDYLGEDDIVRLADDYGRVQAMRAAQAWDGANLERPGIGRCG